MKGLLAHLKASKPELAGTIAVSYTHLDVYKRQGLCPMMTASHSHITSIGMLLVYLLACAPIVQADDDQPSFATLMQSANDGNAEAQFKVGQMFELSKALPTAISWYVKAAEQKYEPAATQLFTIYGSGAGVTQDLAESVKWARVSAGLGNNLCQFVLGVAYLEGTGVEKDPAQAAIWFKRAADGGRVEAQIALANLYASGTGVSRNQACLLYTSGLHGL